MAVSKGRKRLRLAIAIAIAIHGGPALDGRLGEMVFIKQWES